MKFLFKIWSRYDGFRPGTIEDRLDERGFLELRWDRYVESVEVGSEIWVYFHGEPSFEPGVYIKGRAREVDINQGRVWLAPREYELDHPLTDRATSSRVAEVVRARGLQVFVLPEEIDLATACDLGGDLTSCRQRRCAECPSWRSLRRIRPRNVGRPARLPSDLELVAAYWVVPSRNFVYQMGEHFKRSVRRTSELFGRFKLGEERLSYPLALGIDWSLGDRGHFDAIVPVPLSPDKAAAGEIHRTRLLARELGRLRDVPVREVLSLSQPTSKRKLRGQARMSAASFEQVYKDRLTVAGRAARLRRVLLIDDVCTEGSTLRACAAGLGETTRQIEVVAATAGLMTVRAAVRYEADLIE